MIIKLAKHDGIRTINVVRRRASVAELERLGADAVIVSCPCRKLNPNILENWARVNAPSGLNSPRYRGIFVQREGCPRAIVICQIRIEHLAQVPLPKYK